MMVQVREGRGRITRKVQKKTHKKKHNFSFFINKDFFGVNIFLYFVWCDDLYLTGCVVQGAEGLSLSMSSDTFRTLKDRSAISQNQFTKWAISWREAVWKVIKHYCVLAEIQLIRTKNRTSRMEKNPSMLRFGSLSVKVTCRLPSHFSPCSYTIVQSFIHPDSRWRRRQKPSTTISAPPAAATSPNPSGRGRETRPKCRLLG